LGNFPIMSTTIHAFSAAEYHYPAHTTPYLLVSNFGGVGDYLLNGEAIRANDQLFYFANAGDELEICYSGMRAREALLMLFDQDMVREAADAVLRPPEYVLDHPGDAAGEQVVVPGIPFGYTSAFRQLVEGVRLEAGRAGGAGLGGRDGLPAESFAEQVLAGFFRLYGAAHAEMRGLVAAKASTRQELYKRLVVARAYMEENVGAPLTVGQIARVALLNRFYFIELFKSAFGVTPHQYLRRKKLEYAYGLLRSGHTVTEVCHWAGFHSVGSFTHLFKRTYGCVPSAVGNNIGKQIP
jgi:AraC family transcriptional regulator